MARSAELGSTQSAEEASAPGSLLDRRSLRLVPGSQLDRYEILAEIGEGGMAVVYQAHDPRLARKVAIKVMHEASSSDVAADRLVREAHALARVIHPNVIAVYDVGSVRGQVYLVEEYVDGGTLTAWLARERPPWREIVRRFVLAGRGLQAAHAAGLVHRDFKPDNVLLGRDGRVRVVDFGLSCSAREWVAAPGDDRDPSALDRSLTRTGAVMGTPAYMAPEQHAAAATDARTDLFGFCVALWEALYGELPFAGATLPERVDAVLRGAIRPAPASPVPRRVHRALLRGLRVAPDERPASMAVLLSVLARPPARTWRRVALVCGAVALAGVAALVFGPPRGDGAALGDACAPLAADATDVFVSASAGEAGTGTAACPVRTLTAALALPSRATHRTIAVAAGTYDRAAGEQFPIVVRGDLTIAGAGADRTRIVGAARIDHTIAGGVLKQPFAATLIIGDTRGQVAIRDVAVAAETATPEMEVYGVVCDRGTMAAFDGAPLPANTWLSRLSIGPGYEAALVVGTSSQPSVTGCNLGLTGSTLKGSYVGAWVLGCGTDRDVAIPVAAAFGDGSEPGRNHFRSLRAPGRAGVGLLVWDCARSVVVRGNTFEDSDAGLTVIRHLAAPAAHDLVIERNSFHTLDHHGAMFSRSAIVDRFDDNWIYEVGGHPRSAAERAIGVVLDSAGDPPSGFPQIRRARGNRIEYTDVGIELRGAATQLGAHHPLIDFGRRDDPGDNIIRCNGTERGASVPGYDVHVALDSDGSGALLLAGNLWDHAVPRSARGTGGNGTELVVAPGAAPAIVLTAARLSSSACGYDARPP